MRILIFLTFTFIISITTISCGGDTKSADSGNTTTTAKDNSNKPAPTFTMANDNKNSPTSKPAKKSPPKNTINNNQNAQSGGGAFSNKAGFSPTNATIEGALSDGQILAGVPNACDLVTVEDIAKVFGISAADIKQKDASHTKSPYTRSCFFRWDGASPNTGILVQVQANPVEEEYAEWVSLFVSSKRTTGEKTMGTNETFKYEKMEGLGDDGSYSHRLGKYFWRDGDKYAFMIAFNTNSAKELQMKNAKTIGNIMMNNYKNL